ncbi:MAG: hypothetical protein V7L04_20910 [Nostoc sp.]
MGHGAWGIGNEGDEGNGKDEGEELITNAQCPMPNAQCPISDT